MVTDTRRWTADQLDTLPDDGGWTRYEIVDGELLMTRSPHAFHQRAIIQLGFHLEGWSLQIGTGAVFDAPGLVFSCRDAVSPDLIWISNERIAEGLDEAGHFTLAPKLVVEVLSPGKENEKRDRETKLRLYSQYGVREYWIVSWQQQTIEVYRRASEGLEFVNTLGMEDTLSSPVLPGFSTSVAQVFASRTEETPMRLLSQAELRAKEEGKREVALNMLRAGMSVEQIAVFTELDREQILQLQTDLERDRS